MLRQFIQRSNRDILYRPLVRYLASGKDIDVRNMMLKGVELVTDAVQLTLGPRGRNVIIEQSYGQPKITKDGVTVAKSIDLQDKYSNLGASLIKSVAHATNEQAGDGTTAATILGRTIYKEGCKSVAAGIKPLEMVKGVHAAVKVVLDNLKENSKQITSTDEISQVATISANGDKFIGDLIASAMSKVGKEGVITCTEGKTLTDELEVVEGMRFDRGYISPYFITNAKSQKCELEDPFVLIYDKKLGSLNQIVKILEMVVKANRSLLIIAEDVEGEALAALVVNKLRGGLKVCACKPPGFGDNRKASLQDIAILTGGTLISEDTGMLLENTNINQLGRAKKITVSKDDTIILDGYGTKDDITERCQLLKESLPSLTSDYEKDKVKERLAKLSSGVAVIRVGGGSEVEVAEKKDRVVDALNATKAAVEEGIVAGGGTALLYASQSLSDLPKLNFDYGHGISIIQTACKAVVQTIAKNAGVEGAVIVDTLLNANKGKSYGYDAYNNVFCDMFKAGIIDPLKVVKTSLSNAASVAAIMTTSEAAIVDLPEKKEQAAVNPMGMPGGYDDAY